MNSSNRWPVLTISLDAEVSGEEHDHHARVDGQRKRERPKRSEHMRRAARDLSEDDARCHEHEQQVAEGDEVAADGEAVEQWDRRTERDERHRRTREEERRHSGRRHERHGPLLTALSYLVRRRAPRSSPRP